MPITELTPQVRKFENWYSFWFVSASQLIHMCWIQVPINPYGKAKKMAEDKFYQGALGSKDEVDSTRKNLNWPYDAFHVPEDVKR